jgi:glycosyltransferase involved in cell wall biosynthesis
VTRPTVSVVLPTFNRLEYLPAAVNSVFAQTFGDWELILADDGSGEATCAYLRALSEQHPGAQSQIQVIWLSHTGNPGIARNAALRKARGEYVAFLDSDDLWMPTKLEVQVAALRSAADCGWSYTDHIRIDPAGKSINWQRDPRRKLYEGDIVEPLIRLQAGIPTPSVLAERALIERAGGFDEQQGLHEDYDLWLRLALLSKVRTLPEPLTCVRRHGAHFSSSGVRNFEARLRVLDKARSRMTGSRQLSTLRSERARNAGGLAIAHAAAGDTGKVWETIAHSWRFAWRSPPWYWAMCSAMARAHAPRWLVMLIRSHRAAARQATLPS